MKYFTAVALFVVSLSVSLSVKAGTDTNSVVTSTNAAIKPYPLTTCVVSGDKLGTMGTPIDFVYQGQDIKFCCPDCKPQFLKDPDTYMKKIQDAEAAKK